MEGRVIIGEEEDWLGGDCLFEGIKGFLLNGIPVPESIFGSEIKERAGMMGKILDEPLVEVGEA